MTYEQKSAIIISQLRADRDRLLNAFDKTRAEIDEQYDRVHPYNISCAEGLEMALEIIDRYTKDGE